MPSFPQRGEVTICEINCDLVTAESLSDNRAKETYGGVLGFVFSPIPFRADPMPPSGPAAEQERNNTAPRSGFAAFKEILSDSFKRILLPSALNLSPDVIFQAVSWHPHKHMVACISGSNQVLIRDYEDSVGKDPCILTSEAQREIKSLEWRPNSGKTLFVACNGGVCLWSESYPGNVPSTRSGVTSSLGTISRGSGNRWTLVDFLRSPTGEQISAISCSPDGRYLASASYESSSFTIWDVAQGAGTPIRRGLGAVSILKWSPTGDYLLTTMSDGTFYLWETNTWTSEPWSSTGGYVTGAAWDPMGRMALLAFSESNTLGSLHFASRPPALDAHLLPVELPEISSLTGSCGIEKIAWDASGERLALSFKDGEEMYGGLIAVYDIKRTPLISPSLVGFIRGPGEYPKPLAFSFHSKFKQGPLLSVCWSSGLCCTYPLIFRTHYFLK
ncbi:aladin isoform X2 [Phalaenopsis equestris]|uniref:aladin isoform X2 n=1 Tax=Phalaenopsis equestris TaxID=78828 RepID=UPI0009E4C8B6|nr:aladin isoform X2 [Phalaenopsis equestris]